MNEPRSWRKSQMLMGWNGNGTHIGWECGGCPSLDRLHTSSGRSQRRSGPNPGAGRDRQEVQAAEQRPDGTVAGGSKRLASSFYQLKTRHCLTG